MVVEGDMIRGRSMIQTRVSGTTRPQEEEGRDGEYEKGGRERRDRIQGKFYAVCSGVRSKDACSRFNTLRVALADRWCDGGPISGERAMTTTRFLKTASS